MTLWPVSTSPISHYYIQQDINGLNYILPINIFSLLPILQTGFQFESDLHSRELITIYFIFNRFIRSQGF